MPRVSVVIPTYNRLRSLQRVLAGLECQQCDLQQIEVIVVSDGSTDGTNQYLQSLTTSLNFQSVTQANQGVAVARNTGIQHATGDLVLFLDDDVVPSPQLISEHVRTHATQMDNMVVLGPMLTPDDFMLSRWVRWEQAMLVKQYRDMLNGVYAPTARQFYTGNTSLARAHVLAAGGFDPRFRRAEDVELAYRLAERGLRFVFNPDAVGYHYAVRSFRSWLEIPYTYGRNEVIFTRDKKQTWLLPTVLEEFHTRNALIRFLVRLCLDRPMITNLTLSGLRGIAYIADTVGLESIVRTTHSGMFNIRYYQGVAQEMGGRRSFFVQIAQKQAAKAQV